MPRYAELSANTAVNRHLTYLTNVTMHNHPEEMRVKQQKDAALASRGLGRHKEQLPRSAARGTIDCTALVLLYRTHV